LEARKGDLRESRGGGVHHSPLPEFRRAVDIDEPLRGEVTEGGQERGDLLVDNCGKQIEVLEELAVGIKSHKEIDFAR
jgi:hypothetical protein